ncbi:hypothetical protein N4G70_31925 [Streptomyces sp. ASQP_92]|uniref:hypothetical protein n=1 Tax=Streptomyces sp. ASQP_92 TaxID=2979116 RepID=UPI0021BEB9A7|nr:hypothetical protein [Streptomyces sp. ASQP_92]MCT9093443.1 hypothetical protein [Streptomyces sp. ASQP_92]
MADYCTNKRPATGSVRQLRTAHLGSKFSKMHGRWVGDCPECGRQGLGVTAQDNLPRHKPMTANA